MQNASDRPTAGRQPVSNIGRRRVFGIGTVMLGSVTVLWLGAASVLSRGIRYPAFLDRNRTDVYGTNVPEPVRGLNASPPAFIAGKREYAVLIVPPAGGKRSALMPYANFLSAAGFPVMMLDSDDDATRGTDWGWSERKAVAAAASDLRAKGFTKIAALGISEGAAAAIFAQSESATSAGPFIAIVADSSYANLDTTLRRSPSIANLNPAFQRTVLAEAGLWLGRFPALISPAAAAAKVHCPLMIIQNRGDQLTTIADADAIRAHAPQSTIWITQSSGHANAIYESPDEYKARVLGFLESIDDANKAAAHTLVR
ncbi:MAG TPA: hypothetical protein VIX12_01835 [Candidatus Binataceae bacterium]